MNKKDEIKLVKAHYKNPSIKKIIMDHAAGTGDIWRAGNANFTHWYNQVNANELKLYDLSKSEDYDKVTKKARSLYWTLNYFEPELKEKTIPTSLTDNDGNKIIIGSFEETRAYSLGVDIDGIGPITKKEVREAVESMAQYMVNKFQELTPKSVSVCFSGGGIYIYLNHNLFLKEWDSKENAAYSWRVLTGCFNKYIEELQEEFYKEYPQYKDKVKPDAINNRKRLFKTLFSVHKKYPYVVIPLDPNNVKIDLRKARLPISKETIQSGKLWNTTYDEKETAALVKHLKKYEHELKPVYKDDNNHAIERLQIKADYENFPPCIKKIIELENVGAGKTRMKTLIAVFLGQIGYSRDEAKKLFDEISNRLGGPKSNIFDSWFGKMSCPSCKTIQEKGSGFPHLNMGELGICNPDDFCRSIKSPFYYTKQKTPSTTSTTSTPSTPSTPSTASTASTTSTTSTPSTPSTNKEKNAEITALLKKERKPYQSIGRGVHNGVFYIGTVLDQHNKQLDAVVTSNREIYVDWTKNDGINEIKEKFGLNYRFPLFADCMDHWWSRDSIRKFYEKGKSVTIEDIFDRLVAINKKFMILEDSRIHYYTALDIMRSFFFPLFPANNRTFHHADKNSGKTNQLMIYRALSFNPISSTDFSSASIYRIIESTGGTILIDDFDNLPEEQKLAIIQHIRTNYKPFKTIRADGNKRNRPYAYKSYSHLVFNNTMGLGHDEITPTRLITIRLLKHKNAKDITVNDNDPIFESLRNDLYVMTLQYYNEVKESFDSLRVPDLSTRELEVIKPVLAIARLISEDIYQSVLAWYTEYLDQEKIKILSNDWEFALLKELWYQVKDIGDDPKNTKRVKVKDISKSILDRLEIFDTRDRDKTLNRLHAYVGGRIKSYVLFKGGHSGGLTYYDIYKKGVLKIMNLHDLTPADFVEAVEAVEAHTHHTGENNVQKRFKESDKNNQEGTFKSKNINKNNQEGNGRENSDFGNNQEGNRKKKEIDLSKYKMLIGSAENAIGDRPLPFFQLCLRMNEPNLGKQDFIKGILTAAVEDPAFNTTLRIDRRPDAIYFYKDKGGNK